MKKSPGFIHLKHHRRSIRLANFDYRQPGAYFITVCAWDRGCLFGKIEEGKMILSAFGQMVEEEWQKTGKLRAGVSLDAFCVMPNHVHGILTIAGISLPTDRRGTIHRAPTATYEQFGKPTSNSIPTIVRGFKSAATVSINRIRSTPGTPVWQRGYYEHVIRNEIDLEEIRAYIQNNPLKWLEDKEHPANFGRR